MTLQPSSASLPTAEYFMVESERKKLVAEFVCQMSLVVADWLAG